MKKLIMIPLLMFCIFANAQTKNIELYDLVKMFAPDSLEKPNYATLQTYANKQNQVSILINGKMVQPNEDLLLDKINWIAYLNQTKTIYSIQATGFQFTENANPIISLFGKSNLSTTSLKKCINKDDEKIWTEFYKIKIAGKKIIWVKIEASAAYGPYMPMLDITCYANEKDAALICAY